MKVVKAELSQEFTKLEIHIFADLHLGDKRCDIKNIQQRIDHVKDTPSAYCLLNGDIFNNATKTSVSDVYDEVLTPMQQLEKGADLFSPIKDKILAITLGNHEERSYKKEGIDLSAIMARELGIEEKYDPDGVLSFIRFGVKSREQSRNRKMQYSVYMTHGCGGGRKEGAKAIRLADMAGIVDADIYIHSHTHLPMIMKQAFIRTYQHSTSIEAVDKLFVNTAASLQYGGYAQQQGYKPSSTSCPVIYLDGAKRDMTAIL